MIKATESNGSNAEVVATVVSKKTSDLLAKRQTNYIFYDSTNNEPEIDTENSMIDEFVRIASESKITDALKFWKLYGSHFPQLADLARKYLSVQASSAAVERMFSIAGHIFSPKRRRLAALYFMALVYLKLNEDLI